MSITKADIVNVFNEELKTSLDTTSPGNTFLRALYEALRWLSRQDKWSCLHTSDTSQSLSSGSETLNWPSDFRKLDEIRLNDGTYNYKPLEDLEGGYAQWLKNREQETTANYDRPPHKVQRGKKWYVDPIADGTYTAKIWYWKVHAADANNIEFDDVFAEALYNATIWAYLKKKKQYSRALFYLNLAKEHVEELRDDYADKKPKFIKYRDL